MKVRVCHTNWTRLQDKGTDVAPGSAFSGGPFYRIMWILKHRHIIFRNKHSTTQIFHIIGVSGTKYLLWNNFYLTASRVSFANYTCKRYSMKNGRFGLLKSKFCVLQKPLQNYNENLGKSLRYEIRNSYKDITQIKNNRKKWLGYVWSVKQN